MVAADRNSPPAASPALWWLTGVVCVVGVALAAPEWVPRRWSREDGPVEYASFACFLAGSVLASSAAFGIRRTRRPAVVLAALGAVLFVAAGEEISWGQRLFGVETPAALVEANRQEELNLHNMDAIQDKAVLAQLAVAAGGLLLPWLVRRRWAWSGAPFFAAYLAYRGARGVAALVGWGEAGKNSEAAELLLALGLLVVTARLFIDLRRVGGHGVTPRPAPVEPVTGIEPV